MAETGITSTSVGKASAELAAMKRSLTGWLKYRTLNDAVLAGNAATRVPKTIAARMISSSRDMAIEQELADRLYTLLTEIEPNADLPNVDIRSNPNAAVQLAQIAVSGNVPIKSQTAAMSGVMTTHPWLWPVLIVGGLLLGVTTAVKTAADVAKEREHYACIQAGACTDYGFWLKAGGITVLAWFAWTKLGLGDMVKDFVKKRRS